MSGYAEFDPEDTRAEPLRIREQAQGFRQVNGQLTGRQDSLAFVLRSLASSFSEVLHPLISARIGDQFYTLQDVVGAMLYGEQVTDGWAEDVVTFQQCRADLVQRWESAHANGFWITRAPGYDNVEPEMRETLYDDARRRVLTELNAEADRAYTAFTVAAQDRGRQFAEGPTVANVLQLMSTGLIGGAGVAILYPYAPVTGPRYGLPREYWGMTAEQLVRATENDPELAAMLVARVPSLSSSDPFEAALAAAALMAALEIPGGSAYGVASADRMTAVSEVLAGVPPEELALLAALFPAVVGNLNGMPFEHRISANRMRIAAERDRARAQRAEAAAEVDEAGQNGNRGSALAVAAGQRVEDLDARIEQYELLLTEPTVDYGNPDGPPWPDYRGRKVLYFDPEGDGSWAELVGTINSETDSVGIFVPGVGTDTTDMWNQSNQATTFVDQAAHDGQQLAMIVWAGGDFPDSFLPASKAGYAEDLVQPLVDFSVAVQQEIDDQAPRAEVPVTVIGHSYGGVAVAQATMSGLPADQLLFVNSPGLGTPPDLANAQGQGAQQVMAELEDYAVYAMAAPWDPAAEIGPLFHGISPTEIDGVNDLETGFYVDGTEITGPGGHSGVFQKGSTAWANILAVLTGQRVLVD